MIVVYGSSISSLTTIRSVVDMMGDDTTNRIVWVQPNPTTELFPEAVQNKLDNVLDSIGVIPYQGCVLDRYETVTGECGNSQLSGVVCVRVVDEKTKETEEILIECKVTKQITSVPCTCIYKCN